MHRLEKNIMEKISGGDKNAFECLFNAYYGQLFNYACEILKDHDLAEEVVEETFVRIWESRQQIHIQTSIQSYLFRSVYNRCLNHLKHKKILEKHRLFFQHHVNWEDYNTSYSFDFPLSRLLNKELENIVDQAISKLPDQCRTIFIMSRYDELKHEKIAEKLGISQNTVKTQISRALNKLRKDLKEVLPFL
jgi:RNA polymerase sigma-70 factor (ECF subfamily)